MKKIAVYGGSFNPPHLGHRNIVLTLRDKFSFDEIHIVPSAVHKGKGNLDRASFLARLDMCKILTADLSYVFLSNFRGDYPHSQLWPEYTQHLRGCAKKADLTFIIGSDILYSVLADEHHSVRHHKMICFARNSEFICWDKVSADCKNLYQEGNLNLGMPGWTHHHIDDNAISSTKIRRLLHEGDTEGARELCHPGVLEYLTKNKIYTPTHWPLNVVNASPFFRCDLRP